MSYALYFWRQAASHAEPAPAVCARLCRDEEPAGVGWLPLDEVKARFAAALPGIEDAGTELRWEGAGSYFEVSWPVGSKPRHTLALLVRCGYGLLQSPETLNRIVEVANTFGCALYDPHTGTCYEQPEPSSG